MEGTEGMGMLIALFVLALPFIGFIVFVIFIAMWIVLCRNVGRIRLILESVSKHLDASFVERRKPKEQK